MFLGDEPWYDMAFWTWYHSNIMFWTYTMVSTTVYIMVPLHLLTSTVLVAEIREAPHVSQSNDLSGHRQDKLQLVAPLSSLLHLHLRVRDNLQRPVQPVRRVHLGRDLFLSCLKTKDESDDCCSVKSSTHCYLMQLITKYNAMNPMWLFWLIN